MPMGRKPFHAQEMPSIGISRRLGVTSPSLLMVVRNTTIIENVAVAGINWTKAITTR